jgi:hypothetical protein
MVDGFGSSPLGSEDAAQVQVGFRQAGLKPERLLEGVSGFVQFALALERGAEQLPKVRPTRRGLQQLPAEPLGLPPIACSERPLPTPRSPGSGGCAGGASAAGSSARGSSRDRREASTGATSPTR